MRPFTFIILLLFIYASTEIKASTNNSAELESDIDYINAFKDTLTQLSAGTENKYLSLSYSSLLAVLNSRQSYSAADSAFILSTYNAFNNIDDTSNAKELSSYLKRQRPFILSWVSPTDGAVSFARLKPPVDWNPELQYPVYIQLHGLTAPANNPIEYVTKPFRDNPSGTFAFDDGYMLAPWGRGNLWYQGISETDIWECLAALDTVVKIDNSRRYITGHSMGGYGAWRIALSSPNTWAALGVHAGALWYENSNLVNQNVAQLLRDLPTYFVCGTSDGLLGINQSAYNLLADAGNSDIEFVTFAGGHEYIDANVENMYLWMKNYVNQDWNSDVPQIKYEDNHLLSVLCIPNPASLSVNINCYIPNNSSFNIRIYDIYGRLIKEVANYENYSGNYVNEVDLSQLPAGMYLVRLTTNLSGAVSKLLLSK